VLRAKYDYVLRATECDQDGWHDDPATQVYLRSEIEMHKGVESSVVVEWMTTQARFLLRGCERGGCRQREPDARGRRVYPPDRTAASVDHLSIPSKTRPLWQPTSHPPLDVQVSTSQTLSMCDA
jgi:hypothetical protein